jgi:hypothetical protein
MIRIAITAEAFWAIAARQRRLRARAHRDRGYFI